MPTSPEQYKGRVPEGVKERIETPEVPEHIEREVKPVQNQITAQVTDDQGQPLMESPATKEVVITLPTSVENLKAWAKGSTEESITWRAKMFLRKFLKALHFGWKIVYRKVPAQTNNQAKANAVAQTNQSNNNSSDQTDE